MKITIFLAGIIMFCSEAFSQRACGTEEYTRTYFKAESQQSILTGPARDTVANETIFIPVVIHLLYNSATQNISNEQIISQIEALNKDFGKLNTNNLTIPEPFKKFSSDTRIRFCLARVDPSGRPTSGIIRKHTNTDVFLGDDGMKFSASGGDNAWDSKQYLNIWVCNLFGRSLGYATMPGGNPDLDGVVIKYDVFGTMGSLRAPFDKGRTATHEVGHWLGLKHIWGDDDCGSDDVDDTPRQRGYNFNCPVFPRTTLCSIDANGDMFMNFMDFTDDGCMNMFTHGQRNKMRGIFALNGARNTILNSFACDSTMATGAPLPEEVLPAEEIKEFITVFPNPTRGVLNIHSNTETLTGKPVEIFSVTGVKVARYMLSSNKSSINVSSLFPGVYVVKIGTGKSKTVFKVVKL